MGPPYAERPEPHVLAARSSLVTDRAVVERAAVVQSFVARLETDDDAECAIGGLGIVTREGAARALQRLEADDFRDGRVHRVLVAAARRYAAGEGGTLIDDVAAIADEANVDEAELWRWVSYPRAVFADVGGSLAERVREAAAKRRRTFELLDELEVLDVLEVVPS